MSTPVAVALITISSLSLITSTANLVILLVGAKKATEELENVRQKANDAVDNVKAVLDDFKI